MPNRSIPFKFGLANRNASILFFLADFDDFLVRFRIQFSRWEKHLPSDFFLLKAQSTETDLAAVGLFHICLSCSLEIVIWAGISKIQDLDSSFESQLRSLRIESKLRLGCVAVRSLLSALTFQNRAHVQLQLLMLV